MILVKCICCNTTQHDLFQVSWAYYVQFATTRDTLRERENQAYGLADFFRLHIFSLFNVCITSYLFVVFFFSLSLSHPPVFFLAIVLFVSPGLMFFFQMYWNAPFRESKNLTMFCGNLFSVTILVEVFFTLLRVGCENWRERESKYFPTNIQPHTKPTKRPLSKQR